MSSEKARVREQEKIARLYAKGSSIREIAEGVDRSYGYVHGVLKNQGVAMRGRGGSHKKAKAKA